MENRRGGLYLLVLQQVVIREVQVLLCFGGKKYLLFLSRDLTRQQLTGEVRDSDLGRVKVTRMRQSYGTSRDPPVPRRPSSSLLLPPAHHFLFEIYAMRAINHRLNPPTYRGSGLLSGAVIACGFGPFAISSFNPRSFQAGSCFFC